MVRLAILLVLLCLAFWEWRSGPRKAVYWLSLFGLFVFFSLRYGQGTDYITYLSIYANVPPLNTLPNFANYQYNIVEIGYFYLMSFFRMFGAHYVVFIGIVTGFSLLCIHRFITKYSPLPMFSLTFFFAVYSLVYMESAARQLIALSLVLGWVLIDWANGKRLRPIIGLLIASSIHTSVAGLFVLLILFWNPRPLYIIEWSKKKTALVGVLLLAAVAAVTLVDLTPVIELLPSSLEYRILSYYSENVSVSLMALGNRALFMAIVFALAYRARDTLSAHEKLFVNLYIIGFAIYLMLMSFDLIASRINVYFRIVDICLIPLLFDRNRAFLRRTYVAMPIMLALISFLYVKDITTTMEYAQYYSRNPLQYPYITIFNTDKLLESKFVNVKNASSMNAYQAGGMSWDEYYDQLQRKPVIRSPIVPY